MPKLSWVVVALALLGCGRLWGNGQDDRIKHLETHVENLATEIEHLQDEIDDLETKLRDADDDAAEAKEAAEVCQADLDDLIDHLPRRYRP